MGGWCARGAWVVFGLLGVMFGGALPADAAMVLFDFDAELVGVEPGWETYFGPTAQGKMLVDTSVADADPSPYTGDYPGAVRSFSLTSLNPGSGFTMHLDGTALQAFVLNGPVWDKLVVSKNPMTLNIPTAVNGHGVMGLSLTPPAEVSVWDTDALIVDAAALLPLSKFVFKSISISYTDAVVGNVNPAEYALSTIGSSLVSSFDPVAAGSGSTGTLLGGALEPGGVSAIFESTSGGAFVATEVQAGTSNDFQTRVGGAIALGSVSLDFVGARDGAITLSFGYADNPLGVSPAEKDAQEEAMLRVYHRASVGAPWVNLPAAIDSASNTITVTATSLSPFIVAIAVPEPSFGFSLVSGVALVVGLNLRNRKQRSR